MLCANKALLDATPSLADQLRPIMSAKTSIVLLQNGVGNEDPLHAAFPKSTIISAVVWTGGKALDPAADGTPTFAQFASEGLTIGVDYPPDQDPTERAAQRADLDRLVKWLRAGGSEITPTDDIQSERWIKVIWNCAWNSLTTVTRLRTNHYFGSSPGAEDFSVALMDEVVAVARAKGLNVSEDQSQTLLARCKAAAGAGLPSSMMMDNEAGRPMGESRWWGAGREPAPAVHQHNLPWKLETDALHRGRGHSRNTHARGQASWRAGADSDDVSSEAGPRTEHKLMLYQAVHRRQSARLAQRAHGGGCRSWSLKEVKNG